MSDPKQRRLPDPDSGGIIRVEKRDRFLTIENETVRDKRLTFGARGLLSYLLSYPNKWELKVPYLIKQSPAGRDAIYTLLSELERFRYLVRKKRRGNKGRISWLSIIYEVPQGDPLSDEELQQLHGGRRKKLKGDKSSPPLPGFPDMDEPYTDKPDTDEPYTARPDTVRPDTDKPHAYVLPSEELPNDELLTGRNTTTTNEGGAGGGGGEPLSRYTLEEITEWALAEPGIVIPDKFADARFRDGRADGRIAAYHARRDADAGSGQQSPPSEPAALDAELLEETVEMLVTLLVEGRSIEELDRQFAEAFLPEQWDEMRRAAFEKFRRHADGAEDGREG